MATSASQQELAPARRLMPPDVARDYLGGLARQTLAKWRSEGGGPQYIKVGKFVFYEQDELDRWLDVRRRSSTSEAA